MRNANGATPRRHVVVTVILIVLALLFPFVFGTGGAASLMEQVFAFGAFAMSYDLLLGYTGVVSFGHAMFFGTGAYAVAIALKGGNGSTGSLLIGFAAAVILAFLLALVVAFLSLRVRDAYFAMITLAVGQVFAVLAASQGLRHLTNANDGITLLAPLWLSGNTAIYYFTLAFLLVSVAFLVRFVHSPVGDILRAIRENESRALSLGHKVIWFKTLAFVVSGIIAALAGGVFAISQSFVSTAVYDVAGVSLMVLLMVMIGGAGTLYGGILGAAIMILAQSWFANLGSSIPAFQNYQVIFGILYILVVRFMPKGVLGGILLLGGRIAWKRPSFLHKSQT